METMCGAKTDVGLKRSKNEDRYCVDPRLGLYVVCDGMGGQSAGDVASELAVDAIHQHCREAAHEQHFQMVGVYDPTFLPQTNWLASAIRQANHVIHREAQGRPGYFGMGTTAVSALLRGHVLSMAHVGDSRLYLIRGDSIEPLTADHSLVMDHVRAGLLTEEEAERSSHKNILTRALGIEPTVAVELAEVPVMNGDIVLLCSDGLTRTVKPQDILSTVRHSANLQAASERLIEMANAGGGEDNTTVIVIAVHDDNRQGFWQRLLHWPAQGGGTVSAHKEDTSWPR